jgi:hypothetical protein
MKNKITLHVILSTLLLLPLAIILENSDGLEAVHTMQGYFKEWMAPISLSLIISALIFGVKKIFKKVTSFLNIYCYTAYGLSIILLFIICIKYL